LYGTLEGRYIGTKMQVRNFHFFYSSRTFCARLRSKKEREKGGGSEKEKERDRVKKNNENSLLPRNFSFFSLFLNMYD